jgi:hypothetical protein
MSVVERWYTARQGPVTADTREAIKKVMTTQREKEL